VGFFKKVVTKSTSVVVLLITLTIFSNCLFVSTRTTLWDRDEPRYARAAVEMAESGNYLLPTFNGQIWFDKPPLLYWLMSLPIRLKGPTELACRFFGVLGTCFRYCLDLPIDIFYRQATSGHKSRSVGYGYSGFNVDDSNCWYVGNL